MKKLLIPILTTAAITPVATNIVACNSSKTFVLKFSTLLGESEGFLLDGFKVDANKEYKFAADFSNVPDAVLADWGEEALCFTAFIFKGGFEPTALNIAKDKFKVSLNGQDITKEIQKPDKGQPIWIGEGHGWKKTDKVLITMVWTESQKSAVVGLIPLTF